VIDVVIRADGTVGELLPMLTPPARRRVLGAIGFRVAKDAKANARAKGGKSFWASIARSVSYQVDPDAVTIGASHVAGGFKETGGTIRAPGKGPFAKGAKWLTIPISNISKGKSVGELRSKYKIFRLGKKGPAEDGDILATVVKHSGGGAKWRKQARKAGFLVPSGQSKTGRQQYGVLIPLFVLKKQVTQRADPWFPKAPAVFRAIDAALDSFTES